MMPKSSGSEISFHRKSIRKIQQWLRSDSDDSAKEENERMHQELEELLNKYKSLKQACDQLRSDYDECRRAFILRRYSLMKSSVKRIIMHVRLHAEQNSEGNTEKNGSTKFSQFGKASNKRTEAQRKRDERRKDMSAEDLEEERGELVRDIKLSKSRYDAMKDRIRDLAESYDDSKRYLAWTRYRMLRKMIKDVLQDQMMNDNLLAQIHM